MRNFGKSIVAGAFMSVLAAGGASAGGHGGDTSMSLKMAMAMADACVAMAEEQGWKINVAVVDSGADLVVFRRQDGAFLGSIEVALMKARTSANFPFSTGLIAELVYGKDGNPGPLPGVAHVPGITAFAGGLPVVNANGQHLGGIGVSGASSSDDELCAQAGIDAVSYMLK